MVETFNLIYNLRNITKQELILTDEDNEMIDLFYKDVKKYIYKKGWIKACKTYQAETGELEMILVCDIMAKEIIKKYGRN